MSLRSMTGFARVAGTTGPVAWAWEGKSVNGRGLDARVRVPPGFERAGEDVRKRVAAAFARGQFQINLTVGRDAGPTRVTVNRAALQALLDALRDVELPPGVRPASMDGLLAVRGIVEIDEGGIDPDRDDTLLPELAAAAERLVADLAASRDAEGAALEAVIAGQVDAIATLTVAADASPSRTPQAIRARLADGLAALLGPGGGGLDPQRLHQEAALLATRADIREELDRLHAHVEAARALVAGGGAVGRRLDFLAQEFGREANTLCAKAADIALSRIGLDLKAVVEQFREQVQNVE